MLELFRPKSNKCCIKVSDDRIRTADFWSWKWPLFRQCHNHCQTKQAKILHPTISEFSNDATSIKSWEQNYFIVPWFSGQRTPLLFVRSQFDSFLCLKFENWITKRGQVCSILMWWSGQLSNHWIGGSANPILIHCPILSIPAIDI